MSSPPPYYSQSLRSALAYVRNASAAPKVFFKKNQPFTHLGSHFHAYAEINVFLKGRCTLHSAGPHTHTFEAGQSCIIAPFCVHAAQPEDGAEFLAIVNEPDGITLHAAFGQRGQLSFLHNPLILRPQKIDLNRYLCDIAEILQEPHASSSTQAHSLLTLYFSRLEQMLTRPECLAEQRTDIAHPKLRECLNFLDANIFNPNLSVHMIAAQLELNADYLSALFSTQMQTPLIPYIRSRRIEMAQKLLQHTQLSAKEVAWNCGFSDASYFSKVFREHTGLTPRAFAQRSCATGKNAP